MCRASRLLDTLAWYVGSCRNDMGSFSLYTTLVDLVRLLLSRVDRILSQALDSLAQLLTTDNKPRF